MGEGGWGLSRAIEILHEAFAGLTRLGPGSEASTARALAAARRHVEPRRILDLGCGTGAQTLVLARWTGAAIVAIDAYAPYLRTLEAAAADAGLAERVRAIEGSMLEPGARLRGERFDLVWAEGSIYAIGFDAGLRAWAGCLEDGGVLALTEATWLVETPSTLASEFWSQAYPAMRTVDENLAAARREGYEPLHHFALPHTDWTDEYYRPLGERVAALRGKYRGDEEAGLVLEGIQAEIDLYGRAGGEYGYVFYVLRRSAGGGCG